MMPRLKDLCLFKLANPSTKGMPELSASLALFGPHHCCHWTRTIPAAFVFGWVTRVTLNPWARTAAIPGCPKMQGWLSPAAVHLQQQQHPAWHHQLGMWVVGNPDFHYFSGERKLLCSVKSNPEPSCVYRKGSDRLEEWCARTGECRTATNVDTCHEGSGGIF